MAQFLNQEVDPKAAKTSVKSKDAPNTTTGMGTQDAKVAWNDSSDNGVGGAQRDAIQQQALTPEVTAGQSFLAGAQESIIAATIRKASAPSFDNDPMFNAKQVMPEDASLKLYTPNDEEIAYLQDAKSFEEYDYRKQQMLEERDRSEKMGANMLAGIAGSVVGDAPLMVLPMTAAGITGKVGLAARTALRVADAGTAIYSSDQLGQSAGIAGAVAAFAGVDQLFDMVKVGTKVAKVAQAAENAGDIPSAPSAFKTHADVAEEFPNAKFDPDAPTKRTAPDTIHMSGAAADDIAARPLKAPIKVMKGQSAAVMVDAGQFMTHLKANTNLSKGAKALLDVITPHVDAKMPIKMVADTNVRSGYKLDGSVINLRASAGSAGKTWNTIGDALGSLDKDTSHIAVHELLHAATAKAIRDPKNADVVQELDDLLTGVRGDAGLPQNLKYAAQSTDEAIANLANNPEWVKYLAKRPYEGKQSTLSKIGHSILKAFGVKSKGTALNKMLSNFEQLLGEAGPAKEVGGFKSKSMDFLNEPTKGKNAAEAAASQFQKVRKTLVQSFSLYDNVAQHDPELASLLLSDGSKVGARRPSVTDFKRNIQLEMDAATSVVEDAIHQQLRTMGVSRVDQYFHRAKFRDARSAIEDKLGRYLDMAYDAEDLGRPVPVPDADIAGIVKAYRESGWASKWHDHATAAGIIDKDAFKKSEYYYPRQYSYDKMRNMINQGTHDLADYRELFRQALRDVAPDMDSAAVGRVAREMQEGIWNGGKSGGGAAWRNAFAGASNDELLAALHNAGVDSDTINKFIQGNLKPDAKGAPVRNFKARTRFDLSKEYIVNGKVMKMGDLMDTDVAKVMAGYNNRMSGRVAFGYAGVNDMNALAKRIDTARAGARDPEKWTKTVDDTIDHLLGNTVGVEMNELMRAASNLANATMLKNSGIYQLTDIALSMKEFGMARVVRSMAKEKWFKEAEVGLKDKDFASRMNSVLRGNLQREMRFRWLNTYADNNVDLQRSSNWFNVTQNIAQTTKHANGMGMVHRMQVNVVSGMVADELDQMLKGSKDAFKRLEKHGLSKDVAEQAIAANKANPGAMLPPEIQMQVEVVGTRMMDQLVQQVRLGESSAFATLNPAGRLIVGYMNFAVAGTNKILRREMNDGGAAGLAVLMAYQFPLMYLTMMAKAGMDGKLNDEDTQNKLVKDAVLNMSAIGGISLIAPIFTGEEAKHSLTSMAFITGAINAMQDVAAGKSDPQAFSRILPLAQEFLPLRAIINNFGGDDE